MKVARRVRYGSIMLMQLACALLAADADDAAARVIEVNVQSVKGKNRHVEAVCVGAGRAAELQRDVALQHLREVHRECGFQYVRFHGIFHEEMGIFAEGVPAGSYNFQYVDQVYDAILATGMKPFVELGFMPVGFARGDKQVFWWKGNVTMPKDVEAWGALVKAFTEHVTQRYGVDEVASWYFEVWNEPNHPSFFDGKLPDYLQMYEVSARAVKSVNARYRVGGPATAGNAWIPEFIAHCKTKSLPVDFISTHTYGVIGGGLDEFGRKQLKLHAGGASAISSSVTGARSRIASSGMPHLPLYYTEWSSSYSCRDPVHDVYLSAPYILTALKQSCGKADMMSYWTFTDVFEEAGVPPSPFHGGFGLINLQGLRKPAFYAYQFLHRLGDDELVCQDGSATVCKNQRGVQALVWDLTMPKTDAANQVYFKQDLPAKPKGKAEVIVHGLAPGSYRIDIYGVGYQRNDIYTEYLHAGSPLNPTREQVAEWARHHDGKVLSTSEQVIDHDPVHVALSLRENDVYFVDITKVPNP